MASDPSIIIHPVTVYSEQGMIEEGYVKITGEKIAEVGTVKELDNRDHSRCRVLEAPGHHLIPGMIDVHIHGAAGADTMDATPEALDTMATSLPREGTTSFLATTITQSSEAIERALKNAAAYINRGQQPGQAEILGVHLEGPFISPERKGAQPEEHIVNPDIPTFQKWQQSAQGHIKLVTLAPEREGGLDLVRHLTQNGVVASIGHSDATYHQVDEAIRAGATHVTHLYNGMRGLHHREPGVAGAALLRDELYAEIIADGIHSRPEMVRLAYRMKTRDRLLLITDAIRAKCLRRGVYDLGGQDVYVNGTTATLPDGTLAGSILKMGDAVKNVIAFTGCSLADIIHMTAVNPARQLKVFDRKGSISTGKDADLVLLDEHLELAATFCRGKLAYQR